MNTGLRNFEDVKSVKVIKGVNDCVKSNYYSQLLMLPEGIREDLMKNINDQYGYDYLNEFELKRYMLLTLNKKDTPDNTDNDSVTLASHQHSNIAKDMQRGYMQLLTNQCS